MALTDRQRHDAYEALAGAFADQTDLVIQLLRPDHDQLATKSDLDRFATKRDLDDLATRMDARFDHQDALWRAEFGRLDARTEAMLGEAVNRLTFRMLPAMATMIAIFGAIAALF